MKPSSMKGANKGAKIYMLEGSQPYTIFCFALLRCTMHELRK